jgi:hypothetical protein
VNNRSHIGCSLWQQTRKIQSHPNDLAPVGSANAARPARRRLAIFLHIIDPS